MMQCLPRTLNFINENVYVLCETVMQELKRVNEWLDVNKLFPKTGKTNVVRCAIRYHLYNLKNGKNTHGGVLLFKVAG